MKLSKRAYLIIYLSIIVVPLAIVSICGYAIPALNHLAFKAYYIYYGGIVLSIASLVILFMTNRFIKANFNNNKKTIDNKYLLKANLIFIIFYLIINVVSILLNYFNVPSYFTYALYVFYPLIYFCLILFLESKNLSRKDIIYILLTIYLLWYLLIPLISFIFKNNGNVDLTVIKSLMYNLLYNYLQFSLLIMPFMTLGLYKLVEEKHVKSIVHKFNFETIKLLILAIILLIINISLGYILLRL